MLTLRGKRTTLRKELVLVGFVVVFAVCCLTLMTGERKADGAGAQSVRLEALNESSPSAGSGSSPSAASGSSSVGNPDGLLLQKTAKKAKVPVTLGVMRTAVVESVSRSTITLKDHVLAPVALQEKLNRKAKRQGASEKAIEISLLEAGLRSVEGVGTTSDTKRRVNAGARLGLPPLAEMEKECRRASLLDSMPPSYCSCDEGEFEQMECGVSASVAKSVANN